MHRQMRDQVEQVLTGTCDAQCERHLSECAECSAVVAAMREQAGLLRELRTGGAGLKAKTPQSLVRAFTPA